MGSVFSLDSGQPAAPLSPGGGSRRPGAKGDDKLATVTEASIQEFRGVFNAFDKDRSGQIDQHEVLAAMESFGREVTHAEVNEMMQLADADGSGKLSFWEFATLMAYQMGKSTNPDKTLHAAFKHFDTDGSGTIEADELREVMRGMGERISERDIRNVMGDMDVNGDGVINYDEFAKVVTKEMSSGGFRLT